MVGTLIFDWDGTLHDTAHLYGDAFRKAYDWLVSEGYAKRRLYTDEELSKYLGMNAPDMWNRYMPELPQEIKQKSSDIIGRQMIEGIQSGKAVLYTGVQEMLTRLREQSFKMVVLSNCKHDYMQAHRTVFRLDRWFDDFYCCEDFDFAPKEEIFKHICNRYPKQFVVIGDRDSDFKVSKAHNLVSVECAYGFGTEEELKNADKLAYRPSEIPTCIKQLIFKYEKDGR